MAEQAIYPSLKGRVVFVTGGGSGIGAAIVEALCRQGARVFFVDIDREASAGLVERIDAAGHVPPEFIECDLRNIAALRAAIDGVVEKAGPIRVLVNNAANDDRHEIADVTPDYFDDRMAVNMKHQFFAAQAVSAAMAEAGGGSIINMSSITWLIGFTGLPIYVTAKAAIVGMTRALARELGPQNIRVNAVLPGWIMTERQVDKWLDAEGEAEMMRRQCLKRRLMPEEVASIVAFLAADDSGICTNQTFVADGGWA
ncbi:MAG: SDR family oxidoreductase [Alphaproteobacteria bacterium]|jgi:NAD(P)-dependent dehydrogenase (short-subunit alcohol dehydrogenase family)|nr:SDR family oxidoreductase [Alphaproteobacteria bacterium]